MELKDTQFRIIADDLDLVLQRLCLQNKISPLSMSGIVLARLVHLNNLSESKDDLAKLMLSIGESLSKNELDKPTENRLH
jgi:hypothetical protein